MRDKIQKRPQRLRKGDIRSEKKEGASVLVPEGQRAQGVSPSGDSDSFGMQHLIQRVPPTSRWDLLFGVWFER